MKVKRNLNKQLGIEISELGFGIMRMPVLEDGKMDRELGAKMIDRAYEAGVNFFDTAHPYHGGESQDLLGKTLAKYPRESYLFATKLPTWAINSKQTMIDIFNEQFTNCHMDYFDFYMMHGLGEDRYDLIEKHDMYNYLAEQKNAGRMKFLGFSYHGNFETFEKLINNYKWDFVMIQYNYVDDYLLEMHKFYDLLEERGIACLVMEPIRGRYLAELPETAFEEMQKYEGKQYTPAAWALRWCRDKSNTAVTISGMSTMEQLEENIDTFVNSPVKLTDAENTMLASVRDIMLKIKTIPCTYCGYCMDCPTGVNIPRVFEVYNQFKLFANEFRAGIGYGKLARDGMGFESCTNCGICSPLCPQDIDIPAALESIHQELEPLRQKFIASV